MDVTIERKSDQHRKDKSGRKGDRKDPARIKKICPGRVKGGNYLSEETEGSLFELFPPPLVPSASIGKLLESHNAGDFSLSPLPFYHSLRFHGLARTPPESLLKCTEA